MTEILVWKDAPKEKKIASCFVIKLTVMSGDGDHYELNQKICNTEDEAALLLTIFKSFMNRQEEGVSRVSDDLEEAIQHDLLFHGFNRYDGSISDLISDYVGRDITSSGEFLASLETIQVSWFNEYAEEKLCKFRIRESDVFVESFSG